MHTCCIHNYYDIVHDKGNDNDIVSNTGAIPFRYSHFGYGTGPVILDSVNCIGNESRITQCPHLGVGVIASYCYHYYDVGVECPGEHMNLASPAVQLLSEFHYRAYQFKHIMF